MPVNTSFYGDRDKWVTQKITNSYQYTAEFPEDEKIKLANFFNTTQEPYSDPRLCSTLGNAIWRQVNNGVSIPDYFDNSICFTAMAGDSPYTKIHYISNRQTHEIIKEDFYDSFSIIPVMWTTTTSTGYGIEGSNNWSFFKDDGTTSDPKAIRGDMVRWRPKEINLGTASLQQYPQYYEMANGDNYSIRNRTTFITQMPVRKIVWVIYVQCCSSDMSDANSPTRVDLQTFLQTTRNTKPIILSICIVPMGQYLLEVDANHHREPFALSFINPQPLNSFTGYWVAQPNTTAKVQIDDNFFNPNILNTGGGSGIPIGGAINLGNPAFDMPIFNTDTLLFNVGAYVDCGVLKWDSFANQETQHHHFLYCNSLDYDVEQIRRSARRAAACFGMFFTESETIGYSGALDAQGMFLGTLQDGIGYGDYTEGIDNRDQPQFNWKNLEESPYVPDKPNPGWRTDPNSYKDGMKYNLLKNYKTTTRRYNLLASEISDLFYSLWHLWDSLDPSEPENYDINLYSMQNFLTNNPLDCFVNLKYFPISLDMSTNTVPSLKMGKVTLSRSGGDNFSVKQAKQSVIYDCGSIYISPQFQTNLYLSNTWIDEHVQLELYLPFCGSVKLDSATYIGKNVGVEYHIDLITGCCTASVYINNDISPTKKIYMEMRSGNCSIDTPISGIQQATLEANLFNATQQLKGSIINGVSSLVGNVLSTIASGASGNQLGVAQGISNTLSSAASSKLNYESAQYNLQHTQLPTRLVGSASPLGNAECYLKPLLIVTAPAINDSDLVNYGHTNGYACLKYGVLKNITSGYTEISNIDLSGIAATDEEKALIRSICSSGIYV